MSARPLAAAITAVSDGLPQTERRQAMRVIILGLTLAVLDTSLVNLALPDIARLLQSDAAHSVWVVNAYQLATLIVLLPLSALGERWGYRRVYLVGMADGAMWAWQWGLWALSRQGWPCNAANSGGFRALLCTFGRLGRVWRQSGRC